MPGTRAPLGHGRPPHTPCSSAAPFAWGASRPKGHSRLPAPIAQGLSTARAETSAQTRAQPPPRRARGRVAACSGPVCELTAHLDVLSAHLRGEIARQCRTRETPIGVTNGRLPSSGVNEDLCHLSKRSHDHRGARKHLRGRSCPGTSRRRPGRGGRVRGSNRQFHTVLSRSRLLTGGDERLVRFHRAPGEGLAALLGWQRSRRTSGRQ
jgi:hypothetical protein